METNEVVKEEKKSIVTIGPKSTGGAYMYYRVTLKNYSPMWLKFHEGSMRDGQSGLFIEDLLEICKHRLECFQKGAFPCGENSRALVKINRALYWLNHRKKRLENEQENTNRKQQDQAESGEIGPEKLSQKPEEQGTP